MGNKQMTQDWIVCDTMISNRGVVQANTTRGKRNGRRGVF
jgi:hypothetical protein